MRDQLRAGESNGIRRGPEQSGAPVGWANIQSPAVLTQVLFEEATQIGEDADLAANI
jgi:hypothetical protein